MLYGGTEASRSSRTRFPDDCSAGVVDEMSRIHECDTLACGGIGQTQDGSMVDERLFDQDMFARHDRRECDFFLGGLGVAM